MLKKELITLLKYIIKEDNLLLKKEKSIIEEYLF